MTSTYLEIERVSGHRSDIPSASHDLFVGYKKFGQRELSQVDTKHTRSVVSNQEQDGHDDVFGNRDDVGTRNLDDGNIFLVGGV